MYVGRSSSIYLNSMILNKFLLTSKAGQNNLAKCEIGKFTLMEKYVQLVLIECIQQSQKFDKVVPFKDVTEPNGIS